MCIGYSQEDKIIITQYNHINEILASLPEDMRGTAVHPARKHLFTVNEEATKLDVKLLASFTITLYNSYSSPNRQDLIYRLNFHSYAQESWPQMSMTTRSWLAS